MPAKRRRSRRRLFAKRRHSNPINPTRRRRVRRHHRHHSVFARSRNPIRRHVHRRRHHRRRNPLGVTGSEIINFAVGGIGLGIAQPLVNRLIGGLLPLGQFNAPVITAVTGWGLGKLFEMIGATKRFAQPTVILGISTAVIQIVQPFISRALAGVTTTAAAPAPGMQGPWTGYRPRGMAGIGLTTGVPPLIVPPPPAPPHANGAQPGMHGLGMRPGMWGH